MKLFRFVIKQRWFFFFLNYTLGQSCKTEELEVLEVSRRLASVRVKTVFRAKSWLLVAIFS